MISCFSPRKLPRSTCADPYDGAPRGDRTQRNFEELLQFVRDALRSCRFAFVYSRDEDLCPETYADDIPLGGKQERSSRLMSTQEEIAAELNVESGRTLQDLSAIMKRMLRRSYRI